MALTLTDQARMVTALLHWLRAQQPASEPTLIETHISFVLVTAQRAYKIKKAVNLGFLDFTTQARRRFYCDEELRLNRRTAPTLYLDVLPVTGTAEQPELGGSGPAIDWALRMRAFAQDDLWDRLAGHGALHAEHVDGLVEALCALHEHAAVAAPADACGQAAQVRAPVSDSLLALRTLCKAPDELARLDALSRWEAQAFDALQGVFDERLHHGRVRECHGDLHLGNVAQVDGHPTPFDCLEFDPALRWTDVMSDVAFMAMDLQCHALQRLAHRFVNQYVEQRGDVDGLRVLRYYRVYRALVRAKVAATRRAQMGQGALPGAADAALDTLQRYLEVALACSRPAAPALILTHGFSGSGKTLQTQSLLELCGAIRLRADVERKRWFGLPGLARSDAELKARLYSDQANEATHARLRDAAALALSSGNSVILDATFLMHEPRRQARALADRLGVGFVIVDFQASAHTLRQRVERRALRADDASEADLAVLATQLANAQPLRPEELASVFVFDADPDFDEAGVADRWAPLLRRLGLAPA